MDPKVRAYGYTNASSGEGAGTNHSSVSGFKMGGLKLIRAEDVGT